MILERAVAGIVARRHTVPGRRAQRDQALDRLTEDALCRSISMEIV
jgi:hypothetical protein